MKKACLSRLVSYKMSGEDIRNYLKQEGLDLMKDMHVTLEDDGAMVCYEQEEEDEQ